MSVLARLLAFAGVLAAAFGLAALVGSRLDVRPGEPAAAASETPAMAGMDIEKGGSQDGDLAGERTRVQLVRGLAVSEGGLSLELAQRSAARGTRFDLAFRIADRRGRTVRRFDVEHTKRMHLIVVRRDQTGFQHLHPTQRADGSWSVPVTLRAAGSYRVFADFSAGGKAYTLAGDLTVDGSVRSRPLPAPARSVTVDGMRVALTGGARRAGTEAELAFAVTRAGRPVPVEPYLGARGHLVALREGDLAFLHVHPDADRLRFMATFPSAGRYRLFLQFKVEGRIHTAELTREVAR
jgi:hypothetical protein